MMIYFASDFHLGVPDFESSLEREKKIVNWLDDIKSDAVEIYLMGDLFDFWFEYSSVVPRGFVRLLGKIAEITDAGTPVHIFTGNHDMWMGDYLPKEINVTIHKKHITKEFGGKKFFIGHGDGLGPGDRGYKFIKAVFANPLCQWLYARLHPNLAFRIAQYCSGRSRVSTEQLKFLGEDREFQVIFARETLKKEHFDYFIFGHRHIPMDIQLTENSRFINLGDWIINFSYAVFSEEGLELKRYENED